MKFTCRRKSAAGCAAQKSPPVNCCILITTLQLLLSMQAATCQRWPSTAPNINQDQPAKQEQFKLEPPIVSAALFQPAAQGPGVDLVALNWRRFEHDHRHPTRYKPNNPHVVIREHFIGGDEDADFVRGQMIEARLTAIPERLLSRLPEETSLAGRQLIESFAEDPALMGLQSHANPALTKQMIATAQAEEDPDGASIERLTKSCLTVQASSLPADQLNVTFHLYTRRNLRQAFVMGPQVSREEILSGSPFLAAGRPIKWITHGFHTNLDKSEWMLEAKDKILAFEDANVILTDWRRGATPALAFYPKAAANAHVVAKMIIKILRRIRSDIDLAQVHLIGHSLGAHIMGFVGSAFTEEYLHRQQQHLAASAQEKTRPISTPPPWLNPAGHLIGRITACDPALPCFGSSSSAPSSRGGASTAAAEDTHRRLRRQTGPAASYQFVPAPPPMPPADDWTPVMWTHLRPDSAVLVEVIHSNPGVMGYAEPLGDFDFFPNGSDRQPGCSNGGQTSAGGGAAAPAESPHLRFARDAPNGNRVTSDWPPPEATPDEPQSKRAHTRRPGSTKSMARASLAGLGGLSKTLSQFIKPIRDFFLVYTCSHHRSVEYMVESLYYELVPLESRIDPKYVCQMVGYRCPNYGSFKRGYCFTCRDEMECRAFGQSAALPRAASAAGRGRLNGSSRSKLQLISEPGYTQTLAGQFAGLVSGKEQASAQSVNVMATDERSKRIMPTTTYQYRQNYKPVLRNQYYFDTRAAQHGTSFCLHHYHLLVKYRWFRIRESVQVERFRLFGSINDFSSFVPADSAQSKDSDPGPQDQQTHKFHKFTQHAYTMLLTTADFLGRLETLLIYGDSLKPNLIEHIEISYLSNLDPQVRASSSARLCRSSSQPMDGQQRAELAHWLGNDSQKSHKKDQQDSRIHLFVRCSAAGLVR